MRGAGYISVYEQPLAKKPRHPILHGLKNHSYMDSNQGWGEKSKSCSWK